MGVRVPNMWSLKDVAHVDEVCLSYEKGGGQILLIVFR